MKKSTKLLITLVVLLFAFQANAQVMLSSWLRNTTGKKASYWASSGGMNPTYTFTNTTDSADVLIVAYDNNFVYIRSNGMTDSMGKFLNPGNCTAQAYTHKFPRAQTVPATKVISPKGGQIGLLINGVPIYGLSNAFSWNGTSNVMMGPGIWSVEVGKSEGFVIDTTLGAHPQQQGAYHSHDRPSRLYSHVPVTQHSPIVGYAFDGNPVYGPYGYSMPMDAASGISRMKTGYSLRNITTRTTLPYGVAASQTGPAVSATYPIGTYCEDWEWLASNGGDLDKYNGRFCVTPEYPSGTYAYFVTIDAAGAAAFPYYIGIEYYGAPEITNFPHGPNGNGLGIPTGVTYYTGSVMALKLISFEGKKTDNGNNLSWIFNSAVGETKFYLQRSTDAEHFNDFAVFTSSAQNESFNYTDLHPMQKNYYRLKIVEATGPVAFSNSININNTIKSTVLIYPTVTGGNVYVQGLSGSAPATIMVSDAFGRKLLTKNQAAGLQNATINLSMFAKGMYFVTIDNNGVQETKKVIKN